MTDIPELLHRFWGMDGAAARPLGGGINSETWLVKHRGSTYVAKRVPPTAVAGLIAGAEVASTLAAAGFVTGPPVPTCDGRRVLADHGLALLEHVTGRELEGDTEEEQRWMATTLAGVHRAGGPAEGSGTSTFQADWLSPRLPGVASRPWLLSAIEAVRAETDPLTSTWSVLHTDPAPEAFVHDDRSGVTGLIDWAGAQRGPILYDVASTVMYLGGAERASAFLDTYVTQGPLQPGEIQLLEAFQRFRWAVQAAYFAWRLAACDVTGGVQQVDNQKGLDDARRGLIRLEHLRPPASGTT